MAILGVERGNEAPHLQLTPELTARAKTLLGASGTSWIAVMPGAAYARPSAGRPNGSRRPVGC